MLRATVRPALRRLGFIGSGPRFDWPSPGHFAGIGFQKSQFGDRSWVLFTVNAMAVPVPTWTAKRALNPRLPARPSPSVGYGAFMWHERIGLLMPGGRDHWWELTDTTPVDAVGDQVVHAVEHHVLPALVDRCR